jgi:fructose-bisphosphate aldolase class 1
LQKTVSQSGFAMVNMCDDAEIPDILQVLLFSGGKGNQNQRGWNSLLSKEDASRCTFWESQFGFGQFDFKKKLFSEYANLLD